MTEATDRAPGGYLCPACGAAMTTLAPCPRCGRGPDAQAPRLVELDGELAGLATRIEASRRRLAELDQEWNAKSAERHQIAQAMMAAVTAERARIAVPAQPQPQPRVPVADAGMPWAGAGTAGSVDATPRTVQNVLFVLGGILLGVGAIVFT